MSCLLYSQRQACCAVPPHWLFFFLFLFDRSDELVLWEEPLLISHDDAVGQRLYKPLMITTHLLRPSKTLKRIIQTISSPQDCMDRESPPPPNAPDIRQETRKKKALFVPVYTPYKTVLSAKPPTRSPLLYIHVLRKWFARSAGLLDQLG